MNTRIGVLFYLRQDTALLSSFFEMPLIQIVLLLAVTASICGLVFRNEENQLLLTMPNVAPQEVIHLHHAFKLDPQQTIYITTFIEQLQYATHGLLLVCKEPFSYASVWSGDVGCKDSDNLASTVTKFSLHPTDLQYPEDVGLKVGGDTEFQYLVLRVHYENVQPFLDGKVDHSGLKLIYTETPPTRLAGQLMLQSNGYIRPGRREHFETAVVINEDVFLHPFAFRVHTHMLGEVVSAYRVRGNEWTEIGRRSPQLAQIYVPANPVTIQKGDVVASRCTLFNDEDHVVRMGAAVGNEMCKFVMMYYVNGANLFSKRWVVSEGPPNYYWNMDQRFSARNVPDDASEVPSNGAGADEPVEAHNDAQMGWG